MSSLTKGDEAVRISDLNVTFATDGGDVRAVDGVSLSVRAGEVLAIVGESGSGKTVTAKTILGLLPETATTSGIVLIGKDNVIEVSHARLREIRGTGVAMVFQEPSTALNPVFTVGWQIAEGLRAHGKYSRAAAKAKAIEILDKVGIPDAVHRVDHYPHQFSGGQKQRIVIAMALVLDPELIVADEPTTALDVTVQAEILDLLRRCRDEFDTAIVLITHNMGVVADLADRVAVMYQGKLVEEADATSLFENPQHEYTKRLLAAVPYLGAGTVKTRERAAERELAGGEPLVVAKDLVIEYPGRFGRGGFRAVDGVNFQIGAREVLGLVGESGSGKTTIGRAIGGLTRITGGSLTVLGQEMLGVREHTFRPLRRDIGFVFQDPATSFNPLLTIAECVAEPLIVHRAAGDARAARARVDERIPGQGAGPPAETAHRGRADERARRVSPGEGARAVCGAPEGVRLRCPVHQPRPRRGRSARRSHCGAAPRRAGGGGDRRRGAGCAAASVHEAPAGLASGAESQGTGVAARGVAAAAGRRLAMTTEADSTQAGSGSADSGPVVWARDLSIHYRSNGISSLFVAVRGVTLQVARGEFLGVVGESGSGKSTLAMAIAGLAIHGPQREGVPEISGGALSVLGTSLRRAGRRSRDRLTIGIGYLAQNGAERLNPQLTVAENVAEPIYSRDRRFPSREASAAVASVIDSLRLPLGVMQRMPYELSSGQRQRVALARALVLEPKLLVADEPTRGVDATVRAGVLDALDWWRRERGMTAVIVSSSLSDAIRASSRLAVMQGGVIVGLGTVDEVLDGPYHPYLKSLAAQRTPNLNQGDTSVG
jgi:peptide/nickel transport system ATP-binding protein